MYIYDKYLTGYATLEFYGMGLNLLFKTVLDQYIAMY